jgi:hypothetical protein
MIGSASLSHGLYMMEVPTSESGSCNSAPIYNVPQHNISCNSISKSSKDSFLWHRRLGHLSLERQQSMST